MQSSSYRLVEIPVRHRARRRLRLEGPPPAIYAVGDIHGCYDQLVTAEARIRQDAARRSGGAALVVYLGDYVDRGPQSAAVLDHLTKPHDDGLARIALCGNHDDTFLNFLEDPAGSMYWLGPNFGGAVTLQSYGIDPEEVLWREGAGLMRAVPQAHQAFLGALPVFLHVGNYLFVHAGVRPAVALEDQEDEDLIWIREPFLTDGPGLPLIVVHGHTPSAEPDLAPGRIGIDTGCFATGRLTVLRVDGTGARFV